MLFIVVCQRAEFNVDRHGSSDRERAIAGGRSRPSSSSSSSWILAARGIRAGRRVAPSAVCVSRLTGFWGHEVGSLGHGERQLCIVPRQTRAHQSRRGRGGRPSLQILVMYGLTHHPVGYHREVGIMCAWGERRNNSISRTKGAATTTADGQTGRRAAVVSDLGWLVCEVIGARSDSPIAKIFGCIIMSEQPFGVPFRGICASDLQRRGGTSDQAMRARGSNT
jgi:hypothetical protein